MPEKALAVTERPKVALGEAAGLLAEICDRIDGGEEPGEALVAAFGETRLDLAHAVDRRIAFDSWVKGAVSAAKAARDEWAERARVLETVHERFKENTRQVVESHPDLPYQGNLGRICLQKNPPSLVTVFEGRTLTPAAIEENAVDPSYVKTTVTYTIDTAAVKADLAKGTLLPWAKVVQGSHIRFKK